MRAPQIVRAVGLSLFVIFAVISCGGGGGGGGTPVNPASLGSVVVNVSGVPAGSSGSVVLTGSAGYTKQITANGASTFSDVPIGSASVVANEFKVGTGTYYGGTVSGSPATVVNGQTATITVTYAITLALNDPLYIDQWNLKNTGQRGNGPTAGTAGEDINVEPVWRTQNLGAGSVVAVIDNGIEIAHEDLAANVLAGRSFNYLDDTTNPTGRPTDSDHGTAVAGIIAARDNTIGGRGVAPRASLIGFNPLVDPTVANFVDALTRTVDTIHISSNSWGAGNGSAPNLFLADAEVLAGIESGLVNGRGRRGTVYVFSAGNMATFRNAAGTLSPQNSNSDGLKNFRGVITVGAVNDRGLKSPYSEKGANVWISAPGGESCDAHAITTTDRAGANGLNGTGVPDYTNLSYTKCMNGTSSAAPTVSGVVALMLAANPNLGYRDVRWILAETARKNDPTNSDWRVNGAGFNVNHSYGFGVVNAGAAVNRAKGWINLGAPMASPRFSATPGLAIPDNNATGVSNTIPVAGSGIGKIERVEIFLSAANHTFWGDLEIVLTAPSGTPSILAEAVPIVAANAYNDWRFSSVRHLGEPADGNWTLTVRDRGAEDVGTFESWGLIFYGRAN